MTGNPYHDETGRFCSKEEMGAAVERVFDAAARAETKPQREEQMRQWFELKSEYDQLNASPASSQQALASAWEDVQLSIADLPVDQQLEVVHKFRLSIGEVQTPIAEISGSAAKEEERLIEQKWTEAEPRDFLALDDYAGLQKLTEDASWGSAPNDYQNAFVAGLDPHFKQSGTYDSSRMLPLIEVQLTHGEDQAALDKLADTLQRWTSFTLAHRNDQSNEQYRDSTDYGYEDDGEDEAPESESFQFFTYDTSAKGIPLISVYGDGQASAYMQVYGAARTIDSKGEPTWESADAASLHAARKPLPQLLGELTKVWYYPESSNPNHKKSSSSWSEEDEGDYDFDDL